MYPKAYIQFLLHFHSDRDYFECHEILEEYWKEVDPGNKDSIWVAFIQLAVASYHHRRGNFNGAKKTLEKSLAIFIKEKNSFSELGLNVEESILLIKEQLTRVNRKNSYHSLTLPINDPLLLEKCKDMALELGQTWGQESDIANPTIVHKHSLRDRTDVIEERRQALIQKGSDRN